MKEAQRDQRSFRYLEQIWQDIRYALRQCVRSPGFSLTVVLTLICGVGVNTAVFTATDAVLLKSLPVRHPEELIQLDSINRWRGNTLRGFSYQGFEILKGAGASVVSGMFAYTGGGTSSSVNEMLASSTVIYRGNATIAKGMLASESIYHVLGVTSAIGTLFKTDESSEGTPDPVVVLSYEYWQSRFGGDRDVIGQGLRVNGIPLTIIGVTAPRFRGIELGYSPDFTAPLSMASSLHAGSVKDAGAWWLSILARKKPHVTDRKVEAAVAPAFRATVSNFVESTPAAMAGDIQAMVRGLALQVRPAANGAVVATRDELRRSFTYLSVIVLLLLGIACVNVANLLLARTTARQSEIRVRLALGAGRARVFCQLLTEVITLVCISIAPALTVGFCGGSMLLKLLADDSITRSLDLSPDWRLLVFTGGTACASGICLGVIPGLQLASLGLRKTAIEGRGSVLRMPDLLMAVQIAMVLVLSSGAGLFVRSFQKIQTIDPGFRTDDVLAVEVSTSVLVPGPREQLFISDFSEHLRRLPDVRRASFATSMPGNNNRSTLVRIAGQTQMQQDPVGVSFIGPDYFETLGIPLVLGRQFTDHDGPRAMLVAIVDQAFLRRFIEKQNPIGRTFTMLGDDANAFEIVGVMRDAKEHGLLAEAPPMMYLPYTQHAGGAVNFLVRTSGDPSVLIPDIRRTLKQIDASLPLAKVGVLKLQTEDSTSLQRILAELSTIMGSLALVLASVGLYGAFAYKISRQRKEIGIRMALGAPCSRIFCDVYQRVFSVVVIGLGIGLVCLLPSVHMLRNLLYGVAPADPAAIVGAAVTLCTVASVSVYFPARMAARVDPSTVLRND